MLGGLLFEAVHQLTQVVASIAKSGPEHYADISFFVGDFALRILARSSRAALSSFSKRSHHIPRGISPSLGSFGIKVQECTEPGGEVSYPKARKCSHLNSMFLKYRL